MLSLIPDRLQCLWNGFEFRTRYAGKCEQAMTDGAVAKFNGIAGGYNRFNVPGNG